MSTVLLFHSALGLRPAVHHLADRFRAAGNTVHTPDLFEGGVFDDLEEAVAHRDAIGIPELARRGAAAAEGLPADVVYAGFSMGVGSAEMLALTRPGARGALLYHGALPTAAFNTTWPTSLPLQVHTMEHDPWVDLDVARTLTAEASGELYTYPGAGHLFTDPDLPDYDPRATALLIERSLALLEQL
jgi:dienelactone hydrolase